MSQKQVCGAEMSVIINPSLHTQCVSKSLPAVVNSDQLNSSVILSDNTQKMLPTGLEEFSHKLSPSNQKVEDMLRRDNEKLQNMYISMQRSLTEKESKIHILEQSLKQYTEKEMVKLLLCVK